MSRGPYVHLTARHYLPSWQGGDIVYPLCRGARHGAPRRGANAGFDLTARPDEVDCPRCRAWRSFPLPIEQRNAA